ncbi:hypothetical protein [Aquimarina hainanensis]|uniref:hypothetical protein n=1 Tax=Aquimarina hainanensis TaxID=1578017 RepID=UPI003606F1CD
MLKKILKLDNVHELTREQKKSINGKGSNPTVCQFGILSMDCSTNTNGNCTCINFRCVRGPRHHCR